MKLTHDVRDPLSVLLDFGVDSRSSGSSTTDSPTYQTCQLIPAASEAGQRTSRVPLRQRQDSVRDSGIKTQTGRRAPQDKVFLDSVSDWFEMLHSPHTELWWSLFYISSSSSDSAGVWVIPGRRRPLLRPSQHRTWRVGSFRGSTGYRHQGAGWSHSLLGVCGLEDHLTNQKSGRNVESFQVRFSLNQLFAP